MSWITMTSGDTFPLRFTKIDELALPDHYYLSPEDDCYFLGEYTARQGYAFSATNNLILNFKKPVTVRGQPQWRYKERAIIDAANAFCEALNNDWLNSATLIPIPPSKAKSDPLYDDRLVRMLRAIRPDPPLDIRELIVQSESTDAVHDQSARPGPADLIARYKLDPKLAYPSPAVLGLVDDVLTTGAHFKAGQTILQSAFPNVRVIGFFIARRVPKTSDVEEFL